MAFHRNASTAPLRSSPSTRKGVHRQRWKAAARPPPRIMRA